MMNQVIWFAAALAAGKRRGTPARKPARSSRPAESGPAACHEPRQLAITDARATTDPQMTGSALQRHVGRAEVVVDRLGDADHVQAVLIEALGDAERVLAADRDQPVEAGDARSLPGELGPSSRA